MSTPSSADMPCATFSPDLFSGQTVLVTGGTSGIGACTARYFHKLGARVIAVGLTTSEAPFEADDRMDIVDLDVTNHDAMERTISKLNTLNHLILCAGISLNEAEWELESFRRVIEVNLIAGMAAAKFATPLLAGACGSIVTVASMYAYFGGKERPAYAASKGGVVQLSKSLAQSLAEKGVRVNAVAPGWIETPLARDLDVKTRAHILERIPAARWGNTEEVASVIAFLCSPAASYITGAVVPVDGGYMTR